MKKLTEDAEAEIVVMESLFCIGGEFCRVSDNIIRIKFYENCFITFEIGEDYPLSKPSISVSLELMSRSQNDLFSKKINEFKDDMEGIEQQMLAIIDFSKDTYEKFKDDDRKEAIVQDIEEEILIVKIDHMRKSGSYTKTLEYWSKELGLVTLVVTSCDQGIILLSQGDKCQVTKFLLNWKTTNIDVDSRGKPCKERMIQILHREKVEDTNISLKTITEQRFAIKNCDKLSEFFKNSNLECLITKTFYSN